MKRKWSNHQKGDLTGTLCRRCGEPKTLRNKGGGRLSPECVGCATEQRRTYDNWAACRLASIARNARDRGLKCNLTHSHLNEIKVDTCPILGIELEYETKGIQSHTASLDRIDNDLGYIIGNVQFVSYKANAMKRDASREELIAFARWVEATL